jgi:hypothetical protein
MVGDGTPKIAVGNAAMAQFANAQNPCRQPDSNRFGLAGNSG